MPTAGGFLSDTLASDSKIVAQFSFFVNGVLEGVSNDILDESNEK